jgi:copper(I)-binding protein
MRSAVRHTRAIAIPALVLAAAALVPALVPALAQEYKAGQIRIEAPWLRATPAGAEVAGGYMKLRNAGSATDRLVGGASPVAGTFEVHEMKMEGSIMKMRELPNGLEIKPGESVELKPGSYHIMLMGLKRQLKEGETVKGSLTFEKAGTVEVEYAVRGMGSKAHGGGGHGGPKH